MGKQPDRYRSAVVPCVHVDGASEVAFYERAFDARYANIPGAQ